uniref:Uncharacterized protein n=1 Tax=Anguilla anguilla TaxID=7936 RepID=A0A0E9XTX4_ANGAN
MYFYTLYSCMFSCTGMGRQFLTITFLAMFQLSRHHCCMLHKNDYTTN